MGNDIYIAPEFLNSDGTYVGVLDNQHYFQFAKKLGLDPSKGLQINMKGEGEVEILDVANNFKSQAFNIHEVQTSEHSNDTVNGDATDNRFYSYGGTDTFYGGAGNDQFTLSKRTYYEPELEHKIKIEDYESGELIRLRHMNFTDDFENEGSVRYDSNSGYTVISKNLGIEGLEDLVEIKGFWEVDTAYADDSGNLTLSATSPFDIDPNIEGTSGNDDLAAYGSVSRYDEGSQFITKDLQIKGYEGWDRIAGGAGNDYLDGGEEAITNKNGRDVDSDGNVVQDRLYYIDATSGINANFETGIVTDDGFGGTDTVLNFERVYGSYHDDIVQLSHEIYRGYMPLYGNDTIKGPSTQEVVNNSYLGYWNLVDADTEHKSEADPNVSEAYIIFNFDAGTVDKYITGGVYDIKPVGQADYRDTFSGL